MKRYAGVLLPVTSLPSKYGIGCFDQAAYDFVDWLQKAGQRYWQILPLGATSYGSSDDSPYQAYSAFAGNPYLISLDALVEEGVLTREECDGVSFGDNPAKVDFDKCVACGACANICPKHVIMIDAGGPRKPVVMCSNQDKGAVANKLCTTSCIACGMCERTCKFDAIHVVDGVARVDYDKCKGCGMCAQKCPKHIILFPLKDDPNPPKPVVKQAPKPAAAPAAPAEPAAKAEEAKAPEAPKAE